MSKAAASPNQSHFINVNEVKMSWPHIDNDLGISYEQYKWTAAQLCLFENWTSILRYNRTIYRLASNYYSRLDKILTILSLISGFLGASTLILNILSSLELMSQIVIYAILGFFVIVSLILQAIVQVMKFKSKSMSYHYTAKLCNSLIREMNVFAIGELKIYEFVPYVRMVKIFIDMIANKASSIPSKIIKGLVFEETNHNVLLYAFRDEISSLRSNVCNIPSPV